MRVEIFAILKDLRLGQIAWRDLPSFIRWLLMNGISIPRKEETNGLLWSLPHQRSNTERSRS